MKAMMSLPNKSLSFQKTINQILLIIQNLKETCQDYNMSLFYDTFLKHTHAHTKNCIDNGNGLISPYNIGVL